MAYLYKAFRPFRIVLCLGFFLGSFESALWAQELVQGTAPSQESPVPEISPYTVENITVDVTADNALKAREEAFAQAQIKAFAVLAEKMVASSGGQAVKGPAVSAIAPMIDDYEVTNEKLSSKRYIGTYTFRFSEKAVQEYFGGQGVAINDTVRSDSDSLPAPEAQNQEVLATGPLLVLPFLEQNGQTSLWSPENGFLQAWASVGDLSIGDLNAGALPLIVPIGDLADVGAMGEEDPLHIEKAGLATMLERYQAQDAVLLVAKKAPEGLAVEIYRTDLDTPELVSQKKVFSPTGQEDAALYASAVALVRAELTPSWKTNASIPQTTAVEAPLPEAVAEDYPVSPSVSAAGAGPVSVRVGFQSLGEWSGIQRGLARVSGMSDIALKALSPQEAYLDLLYRGNIMALRGALAQAGLRLSEAPRGQSSALGAPVYDLSLGGTADGVVSQQGQQAVQTPRDNAPHEWKF